MMAPLFLLLLHIISLPFGITCFQGYPMMTWRKFTYADNNNYEVSIPHSVMAYAASLPIHSSGGDNNLRKTSPITASDLRSVVVTNADGEMVPLGIAIGTTGTTIVVFLRHLGCTWCWNYVRSWCQLQQEVAASNIRGPIFVSIGDKERLNVFLEKHPTIPRNEFFVDGLDFAAYKEAGFGRVDDKPREVTENVQPKPVDLGGFQGWWTFLTTFAPLAPFSEEMGIFERFYPEGLLWVGGTFIVRGDEIVYRWDDRISGDHPDASDVLQIAKTAL